MNTSQSPSVLSRLTDIHEEIRQTYLAYPYPWVIGYSGGKDSTATLQLVWYALAELPPEQRTKPVYVISTDTKVETPVIVDRIDDSIRQINEAAETQQMNLTAHKLSPILKDSFCKRSGGYRDPKGFTPENTVVLDVKTLRV